MDATAIRQLRPKLAEFLARFSHCLDAATRRPKLVERSILYSRRHPTKSAIALMVVMFLPILVGVIVSAVAWVQVRIQRSEFEAIVEARTKAELKAMALLANAERAIKSSEFGRVNRILTKITPEIETQIGQLERGKNRSELEYRVRSLKVAAQTQYDVVTSESFDLPHTPNSLWPAAFHPAGHVVAIGGPERPYKLTRGAKFAAPENLQNVAPQPRLWFSPSERYLLFAPATGGLSLWDDTIDLPIAKWEGDTKPVVLAAWFSPDEESIQVFCGDRAVRRFRARDLGNAGEVFTATDLPHQLSAAAFRANDRRLAVANDVGNIIVYDNQGRSLYQITIEPQPIEMLAWSPTEDLLAIAHRSGAVYVYDAAARQIAHRFSLRGHGEFSTLFSPDGRRFVAGQRGTPSRIWDTSTGDEQLSPPHTVVGFSSDGQRFCETHANKVIIRDIATQRIGRSFSAQYRTEIDRTTWSADGRRFASLDSSRRLCVTECTTGRLLGAFQLGRSDFPGPNGGLALNAVGDMACAAYMVQGKIEIVFVDVAGATLGEPQYIAAADGLFRRAFCRVAYRARTKTFVLVCDRERTSNERDLESIEFELAPGREPNRVGVLRSAELGETGLLDQDLTLDGQYYMWVGPRAPESSRRTEVWDVRKRQLLASIPHETKAGGSEAGSLLSVDGKQLWIQSPGREVQKHFLLSKGKATETKSDREIPVAASPDGTWILRSGVGEVNFPGSGVTETHLYRLGQSEPVIRTAEWIGVDSHGGSTSFSPTGNHVVWGNSSGRITILDLNELETFLPAPATPAARP